MSTTVSPPSSNTGSFRDKGFFGHPGQLGTLFTLEMWERFSFYGLQAILAYYIYFSTTEGGLGIDKPTALGIVGAYGGGVFLMTILGSWISDRVLGKERTLFISGILIMVGHLCLALIPAAWGLIFGLSFVAIGSGGLKANATAVVGTLYDQKDVRRDAGFSIFYMGVNIGALFGPLLTGLLQTNLGFHYGFGAAALGMLIGLVVYSFGRKHLPEDAYAPVNPLPQKQRALVIPGVVAALAVMALLLWFGLATKSIDWVIFGVALLAAVAFFAIMLMDRKVTREEHSRVISFIPLFLAATAFWTLFQQQFTFIAVYSDAKLDRSILGWVFPAAWVQMINPIFIIIFASVLAAVWMKLGNKAPTTPQKFAASLIIIGVAYLAFIPFASQAKAPLLLIVGVLFLFTMGELLLSPIGLSLATKLAPKAYATQMVALNFLASSIGTTLAGTIAKYYDPNNEVPYFVAVGASSIIVGFLLFSVARWVSTKMKGVL